MNPTSKAVISRVTLLVLAAILISAGTDIFRVVRSERVNTRLSVRLEGSGHELIAALPAGLYQINFTAVANVSPVVASSSTPLLPAQITTSVTRGDSSEAIVAPNSKESIVFSISRQDAFRPIHVRVAITRKQPCQIYMNLAPGF